MDGWGILWLQVSHKIVGGASRARYEHYKGAVTIEAAFSAGCRKYDIRWDLKHCFLMPYDLVFDPLTAVAPGPLAINAGGVVNEKWRHDLVFNPWTALAQGPLARPVSQQCWWCRLRKMAPFVAFLLQKGVTFALQNWRGVCLCGCLLEATVVYACASIANCPERVWYGRTNRFSPELRYHRWIFYYLRRNLQMQGT